MMSANMDILNMAAVWYAEGEEVVIATVTETWGSSPYPCGSRMVIARSGRVAGSVSGGCVEAAVIHSAEQVFVDSIPALLSFGVTDEKAWEVGLACGGKIKIFVEKLT